MNTPIVHPGVYAYVAAVRAQLDDLSADELDELTGGLEADLDDALDDPAAAGRSPEEQFGPPAVYAAELRAAAGLAPRAEEGGRRGAAGPVRRVRQLTERVQAHPRWPAVHDFLVVIRPAWWVVRGALAGLAISAGLGSLGMIAWLVLVPVAVVASVELGRRDAAHRWLPWRLLIGVGNAFAVIMVITAGVAFFDEFHGGSYVSETSYSAPEGVSVNGSRVRNIFPYDDQGRPLSGVQLYDDQGRPVEIGEDGRMTFSDEPNSAVAPVPAVDSASQQRWNVFPLRQQVHTIDPATGTDRTDPVGPATLPMISPGPLIAGGAADSAPRAPQPSAVPPAQPSTTTIGPSVMTAVPSVSTAGTSAVTTAPSATSSAAPSTAGPPPATTGATTTTSGAR